MADALENNNGGHVCRIVCHLVGFPECSRRKIRSYVNCLLINLFILLYCFGVKYVNLARLIIPPTLSFDVFVWCTRELLGPALAFS